MFDRWPTLARSRQHSSGFDRPTRDRTHHRVAFPHGDRQYLDPSAGLGGLPSGVVVGTSWHEAPDIGHGARPHPDRDGWSQRWYKQVRKAPISTPIAIESADFGEVPGKVDRLSWRDAGLEPPAPLRQQGGRSRADALLTAFLRERTGRYPRQMSAPGPAAEACSRLSPHLAVGSVSSREVIYRLDKARRVVTNRAVRAAYEAFESRIAWRGHFMQRLEDDMTIETDCLHPAMNAVR